jgi:hypothetical protein
MLLLRNGGLVLFGEAADGEPGRLVIEWETPQPGRLEFSLDLPDCRMAETLRLLQGSRLITDLEAQYTVIPGERATERRDQKRIADRLQTLNETYGLARRCMSLVAVIERGGDQPGELPKTTVVPVGMPQDVSFAAYFGSSAASGVMASMPLASMSVASQRVSRRPPKASISIGEHDAASLFGRATEVFRQTVQHERTESVRDRQGVVAPEDLLLDLARKLEPDGGMPGRDDFEPNFFCLRRIGAVRRRSIP